MHAVTSSKFFVLIVGLPRRLHFVAAIAQRTEQPAFAARRRPTDRIRRGSRLCFRQTLGGVRNVTETSKEREEKTGSEVTIKKKQRK